MFWQIRNKPVYILSTNNSEVCFVYMHNMRVEFGGWNQTVTFSRHYHDAVWFVFWFSHFEKRPILLVQIGKRLLLYIIIVLYGKFFDTVIAKNSDHAALRHFISEDIAIRGCRNFPVGFRWIIFSVTREDV